MHRDHCDRCFLHPDLCVCSDIPEVANRTHIAILRHAQEVNKASNTGRLAHLALARSSLVDYGLPNQPVDEAGLVEPGTWLLYPEGPALTEAPAACRRVIVLDGTWSQARRMRQRVTALRGLPILSLPPPTRAPRRMRESPKAEAMSTIESIAAALELLEGEEVAEPLRTIYALVVDRVMIRRRAGWRASDPSRASD